MTGTDRVAVVTDSTAWLPADAATLGVHVVPLRVHLGARTAVDGVDVTPADIVAALRSKVAVSTSRPAPAEFAAVYRDCLDHGATSIVSVHLSAALSGTWESATVAAQEFPDGTARVVDSRGAASALGFAVLAAARVAAAGAPVAEVHAAATEVVERTRTLFYVDTLEYLRRSGRVGAATSVLATSLSVKPILHMVEGRISALEKVRTSAKALTRLVELTAAAGERAEEVAVHHLAAPSRADSVAAQLRAALPSARVHVGELGPVLAAHLGPGAIGTVVVRR